MICRRGVDSVTAVHNLLKHLDDSNAAAAAAAATHDGNSDGATLHVGKAGAPNRQIYNVEGGLQEWHRRVDPTFPIY